VQNAGWSSALGIVHLPSAVRHRAGPQAAASANRAGSAPVILALKSRQPCFPGVLARRSPSAACPHHQRQPSWPTTRGGSAGHAPSRVAHQRPPSDTHGRQPGNSCAMADSSAAVSPRGPASRDTSYCGTAVRLLPSADRVGRGPARPATERRRTCAGAVESMHELARNFRQARAAMMSRGYRRAPKLCGLASQPHWPRSPACPATTRPAAASTSPRSSPGGVARKDARALLPDLRELQADAPRRPDLGRLPHADGPGQRRVHAGYTRGRVRMA
jgi:hypothetical protein